MSTTKAVMPAVAAIPMTRPAGWSRSTISPSKSATATKTSTPLPASCQLARTTGASTSNPEAWVTWSVKFQANHPVAVPRAAAMRRGGVRVAGRAANTAATTAVASAAVQMISVGSNTLIATNGMGDGSPFWGDARRRLARFVVGTGCERMARLLAVPCSVCTRGAFDADGERVGRRQVEGVEVDFGESAVESDGFVREGEGERDGDIGADDAELAGRDGDARLAAAVDGVDGGGLGGRADGDTEVDVAQVALGPCELEFGRVVSQLLRGVEEFGAGRVAAGAAVVVGWVPVCESDEQRGVDRFGDVRVAEPDDLTAFLATGAHPARQRR